MKIEEKGDNNQIKSIKKNLFGSGEKQSPPKISRFNLALKSKSKESFSEENMKSH